MFAVDTVLILFVTGLEILHAIFESDVYRTNKKGPAVGDSRAVLRIFLT